LVKYFIIWFKIYFRWSI